MMARLTDDIERLALHPVPVFLWRCYLRPISIAALCIGYMVVVIRLGQLVRSAVFG